MGSVCCIASRDRTLPNRTSGEALQRNVSYSPSWNRRWENRGRVAGELENSVTRFSHGISGNVGLENKDWRDLETEDVSDGGSPLEKFQIPTWQKSPIHKGTAGNLRTPASDLCIGSNLSTEVKDLTESSAVADASVSKLSFSLASTSSSMAKEDPLLSQSHSLTAVPVPSRQARRSPGHQLLRQVSDSRIPGLKSPNNSVSDGRQSFVLSMCSNDPTMGSQGGSSDGWSMRAFSELVASSQRERWSSDSESLGSGHGKMTRSNSQLSASPSVDLQTCGVCSKLLTEKSSWSSQKIIATNELSVVAILVCGHVFHAECLENMTSEIEMYDPSCPVCIPGEKQALKRSGKGSRIEADLKAKNTRISRNQVVDSDLDDDSIVSDHQKSTGREGKVPKMGASPSMRSTFGRPFLKRHFSLGSKTSRSPSLSENDSTRKKGFWARYR